MLLFLYVYCCDYECNVCNVLYCSVHSCLVVLPKLFRTLVFSRVMLGTLVLTSVSCLMFGTVVLTSV